MADIWKRLAAECVGTALLLAISCGSGPGAMRLAGGDAALALMLAPAVSSLGLAVLILAFGPVSGGLFNPVLPLSQAWRGMLARREALPYVAAQTAGACLGVAGVYAMAGGVPWLAGAAQAHSGQAQWLGEGLATFGLLTVFIGCGRSRPAAAPFAVSAYVMLACWFSPSPAFMNPAMTVARALGNGPGRLGLDDAPACILSQLAGAALATVLLASSRKAGKLAR